jgi:hypothetical protein
MRAWWWLLLAACATTPVTVRLAREGELLEPAATLATGEAPTGVSDEERFGTSYLSITPGCRVAGTAAPAVRAAVIAYARAHLLEHIDGISGYRSKGTAIDTPTTSCEQPGHVRRSVTTIMIDGGAPDGMLTIAQDDCSRGAAAFYCMHVDGTTVIVVPYPIILGTTSRRSPDLARWP